MENVYFFLHNSIRYFNSQSLKENNINKKFFMGCFSTRNVIKKHTIPESECLYVKNDKVYTSTYKSAFLYLSETYVNEFILNQVEEIKKKITEQSKEEKIKEKQIVKSERLENRKVNDEDLEYEPELVDLEDTEKFKDENGHVIEIEMRGEREHDKIFLKVYDVSKGFGIDRVDKRIVCTNSDYEYGVHYLYLKKTKKSDTSVNDIDYDTPPQFLNQFVSLTMGAYILTLKQKTYALRYRTDVCS
jgi:hypothetical protein